MSNLRLSFACNPYDRIEALSNGTVKPAGIDLDVTLIPSPREVFDRMVLNREFDMAELSASEFIVLSAGAEKPFVALPVFPSKVFRHGFIVVGAKSGIRKAEELAGKRIGVPLYAQTAAIWIRGLLADDYGVDLSSITWVQGAIDHAGSHGEERAPPQIPGVRIEPNPGRSLDAMLASGEIDAYIGPQVPKSVRTGEALRLFPDYHAREQDYFRRTRIHPIMHLVAIRREVFERDPWIAAPLYEAFVAAKDHAWAKLAHTGANGCMLPFVYAHAEETRALMGDDPWPYGVTANLPTLTALTRYMHVQGLCPRHFDPHDLFVPAGT